MKELKKVDATIIISLAARRNKILETLKEVDEAMESYKNSIAPNYDIEGESVIAQDPSGPICIGEKKVPEEDSPQ